jgi:hypothetical protein
MRNNQHPNNPSIRKFQLTSKPKVNLVLLAQTLYLQVAVQNYAIHTQGIYQ